MLLSSKGEGGEKGNKNFSNAWKKGKEGRRQEPSGRTAQKSGSSSIP